MFTRQSSTVSRPGVALLILTATAMIAVPVVPASAQGIFDGLFGIGNRRAYTPPTGHSYAPPQPQFNFFGSRAPEHPGPRRTVSHSGGGVVYCVRLCDGRNFPIQRHGGANPAQTCNSFCPATQTKIFTGSTIERAVAGDGTRYASLPTAFAYRERIVTNCTCNGKDPVGLVTTTAAGDPTLRQGDIVAGETGFVAYTGGSRGNGEFTPVESYPGLNTETRNRLAGTKVVPNATPVPAGAIKSPPADNRRAQLDR